MTLSPYEELVENVDKLKEKVEKLEKSINEVKQLHKQINEKLAPENPGDINHLYQNWDK